MKIHYCAQYSPAWWAVRNGYPTASDANRILTPKGKKSAAWTTYISELCAALLELPGSGPSAFSENGRMGNPAMQAGRDAEPEARKFYTLHTGNRVQQVGFVESSCKRYGCSPDGVIGTEGGLELKCPMGKTHAAYVIKGGLPNEYRPQVHAQLVVTGWKWVDFMSYCPGQPPVLVRVEPDDYTKLMAEALDEFHDRYVKILGETFHGLHLHPMYRQAEPADPGPDAVTYAEEY